MGEIIKKILLVIAVITLMANPGYSQRNNPEISIDFSGIKLSELLKEISSASGMEFSFNPSKIPVDSLVTISMSNVGLDKILDSLSFLGFTYKFQEKHIILKKEKNQKAISRKKVLTVTLSGYIRDNISGEVLIGATIGDPSKGVGAASNAYGYYSLTVPAGDYKLVSSYIGYTQSSRSLDLLKNTELDIMLSMNVSHLEEVIIVADNIDRVIAKMSSGELEIRNSAIKRIPGMLGETDVLKSIQTLPGISFYSDGSTIFHVRGGDRDQNLILIDEAPIYNPAHLLGLFSAFTPESLNSVNVYRGDMPASYGGRLSSVVDIRLKDGNSNSLVFSGNTGLVATTLNLEGPMFNKKSSFYVSARRSHLRWILDLNNGDAQKLYFTDFNLKYNYRIDRKNRILFSLYSGVDKFQSKAGSSGSSGITWINNAGNLRWNHVFNERLFSNTSFIVSNYDYNLFTNYEGSERWNTGVGLTALKSDFSFYPNHNSTYKAGIYLANHFYSPGNYYIGTNTQPVTRGVSSRQAGESVIYILGENEIGERFNFNYGLRLTAWTNKGPSTEYMYNENRIPVDTSIYGGNKIYNTFTSLEPRITAKYNIADNLTAKISWTKNSQFEYLISNSISPFTSLETWLPASPNIKPMRSNQLGGGFVFSGAGGSVIGSVEGFYKKMINYMGYTDHAPMLFNPHVESEIRYGIGRSYGVEFLIQKPQGKLNGWVSYSYSRTRLKIPQINNGQKYPAAHDRPHAMNTYLSYQVKERWNLSATFTYSTGSPITTPTGFYIYNGYQVPFYDKRNNDRLPDYNRLDISSEFRLNKPGKRFKQILKVSVFNLYGSKNPWTVNFNKIVKENGALVVPTNRNTSPELVSSMMYIYGVMPSISYHFEF